MNFIPQERNLLVFELGSYKIRAGSADHSQKYAVDIENCAGKLTDPNGNIEYAAGYTLEQRLGDAKWSLVETVWPMVDGRVVDWDALTAVLVNILVNKLRIKRMRNDSPVLASIPCHWSKSDLEHFTQIMFEHLNVPGLYISDQPLMGLYGVGTLSGLVVDIGHHTTDITPILDTTVYHLSRQTLNVGGVDIERYLLQLLKQDQVFLSEYGQEPDLALARAIKESSICEIFKSKELVDGMLGKNESRADFEYNGKKFTVGSARYVCNEVLFNPSLVGKNETLPLGEAMGLASSIYTEADKRLALFENGLVSGGCSNIKGLKDRIETEIAPFIAASETSNEFQAKEIKFVRLAEYFTAFKDNPADVTYLGSCIVARLVFSDSKNYITKSDYNEMGPASCNLKLT